jgi:hypothetical protein
LGDAFDPEPQGAFLSFLDWIDKPGQVVRNTLKGNFSGAAKNFGDFLLDPIDAALPGDWIPELAGEGDKVSGGELVGIEEPGIGKFLADIGIGVVTDPISLLTFGASGLASNAGRTAIKAGIPFTKYAKEIPGTAQALGAVGDVVKGAYGGLPQGVRDIGSKVAQKTRLTFAAPKVAKATDELLQQGYNAESVVNQAGQADVRRLIDMIPDPALRQAAFDVANNLKGTKPGEYAELLPGSNAPNPLLGIIPNDIGDPLSDIARVQPRKDFLKIRPEKPTRDSVSDIDAMLGLRQMPLPEGELGSLLTKDLDDPRLLDVTHPEGMLDPRYASGIDVANRSYAGKGKVPTFGSDPLKPSPSELARTPTGTDAVAAARAATEARDPIVRSSSEQMQLSGMGPNSPKRPRVEIPADPLGGVNEMLGGSKAETATVRGESIPGANATFDTIEGHMARYSKRIDAMPISAMDKAKLKEFWAEALPHVQEQYARDVQNNIMFRPQGRDVLREMPADYVQRRFTGMLSDTDLEMLGNPNAIKERTIKEPGQLPAFMNANKDVTLDRDIGSALGHRVEQDARMTKSAVIGKGLIDKYAKQADDKIFNAKGDVSKINLTDAEQKALAARGKALADEEFRSASASIIDEIAKVSPDTDDAIMLRNAISGLAPRGAAMDWLAYTNREFFKPFAVAGAFIPKVGTNVRNAISAVFMVGANKEARGQAVKTAVNLPNALFGGLNDGIEELTGMRLGADEFADIDAAMKTAKGDPARALAAIQDPLKREAVQFGVIDNGFISTEDLLRHTDRVGWKKWLTKARDWPAAFFKGVEQRMRWGLYKGLRTTKGLSPEEAARITRDSLYDYRVATGENRAARDLIPFFQFSAKAIPQTAKLMAEQPAVAVGLSQLMQDRGDPVYPWMEGKTNIPIGSDEEGNDLYATGLGLPFEAMNMIPTSFRDVQKNIVGAGHPILKSLFAATSNKDPFFETPYGSYSKIPGIGEAGEVGQMYNKLAGTGMIQPIDSLLRVIGDATDERHSGLERAADLLTGVNVASVDPDRALQQLLQQALERSPGVRQYRSFYDPSGDPEAALLLQQYQEAKKKVKAKRNP